MIERSGYFGVKPPFGVVYGFAILYFMADRDAPPTEDALVVIPLEERVGSPKGIFMLIPQEPRLADTELISIFFQEAGAALFAGHAIIGMIGKEQLHDQLPRILHPLGIGTHHHFVSHRKGAGSDESSGPFHFYYAQAAAGGRSKVLPVTEVGDADPGLPGSFHEGRSFFGPDLPAVNGQLNLSHFLFLFLFLSPRRQERKVKTQIKDPDGNEIHFRLFSEEFLFCVLCAFA
jgi:hypothetical protein